MTDTFVTRQHTRTEYIAMLAERDGMICYLCERVLISTEDATIDHVWPQSRDGDWAMSNLKLACRPCNLDKGDRVFVDGVLEPKRYRESYKDRRINRQNALDNFCDLCMSGRLLLEDESCPECRRGAVPWPQSYKMEPKDCPHSGRFWCWADVIGLYPREPAIIDVLDGGYTDDVE